MPANDVQIGGNHYKKGGEEHWDRAFRLQYDCFQYIITKWIERWKDKGGIQDLKKARHAIDKYIEVAENEERLRSASAVGPNDRYNDPLRDDDDEGAGAGRGYVDQDSRC